MNGFFTEHNITPRMLIVPFIVYFIIESKHHKSLDFIFVLLVLSLLYEYYCYYFKVERIHIEDYGKLERLGFLRPWGLFLDLHLTSLFIVLYFYAKFNSKIGWILGLIMFSAQTIIITLIMFKISRKILYFFNFFNINLYFTKKLVILN